MEDPRVGFNKIIQLLKPGGFIILGLYNRFGRLLQKARKLLFQMGSRSFYFLDWYWRTHKWDKKKWAVWYKDQYENPYELTHTIDEVFNWFKENQITFVNALPPITLDTEKTATLFKKQFPGTSFEHFLVQLSWIVQLEKEGGLFILIGQKQK